MKSTNHYRIILILGILGLLLSGYLSYWNLFAPSCSQGPLNWLVSCGGPTKVLLLGLPTCVYGFAMFLTVTILAIAGLSGRNTMTALRVMSTIGALFASGLMVYELWILKIQFTGLPACVYGLALYLGILITSILARRQSHPISSI
jgi:uncharacterized membrane protein